MEEWKKRCRKRNEGGKKRASERAKETSTLEEEMGERDEGNTNKHVKKKDEYEEKEKGEAKVR